jgi:hypothetical protein
MIVIMNKGEVYEGLYFENYEIARNYVKWRYPKKNWKDIEPNILKCKNTGMVMRFEELKPYNQLSRQFAEKQSILSKANPSFDADNYDRNYVPKR